MKEIFVSLFIVLAASASALDSLDQWAGKIWAQPLTPPRDSVAVVLTQQGPGKFQRAGAQTVNQTNPDGSFTQEYSGPDEAFRAQFHKNGSLISSTADNFEDKKSYTIVVSPDRKQATFRTEEKGKDSSTKTVALKANKIIMTEYVNLIRQAWQVGVRGSFAFQGIAPDGSMEIDMETKLIETSTPWKVSDQFEYPAEFKAAFPVSQKYLVADFSLGGMFSMLYRFHNYWIFRVTPTGLVYSGSFGGDPKKAIFSYMTE